MQSELGTEFLESIYKRMATYKELAEKSIAQLEEADLFIQPNEESNSIAIIIQHMSGNMLSRWTDLLTSDGEKEWRQRDLEFEPVVKTKEALLDTWEKGWDCFFRAISALQPGDLLKTITIRHEKLTVMDALNRQMAHYPYHVGQIVFYSKILVKKEWESLSIPKRKK